MKRAQGSPTWQMLGGWILIIMIVVAILGLLLMSTGALDVSFIKDLRFS